MNLRQILLFVLPALAIICVDTAAATSCAFDKRDRKSDTYLQELYATSVLIGTFEVTEVGPKVDSAIVGRYYSKIKFRPLEMIKGKVGKEHIHNYTGISNGQTEFFIKKKYLMAFSRVNEDNETINGICSWPFQIELGSKDAKFFLKKLKEIKKAQLF